MKVLTEDGDLDVALEEMQKLFLARKNESHYGNYIGIQLADRLVEKITNALDLINDCLEFVVDSEANGVLVEDIHQNHSSYYQLANHMYTLAELKFPSGNQSGT